MVKTFANDSLMLVDHGSRVASANACLDTVVAQLRAGERWHCVAAAHMELARPTIAEAYGECAAAGATRIVVVPYFLFPGRHVREDIPRLLREAASEFPGTDWLMADPLGLHPGMTAIVEEQAGIALGASASDNRVA